MNRPRQSSAVGKTPPLKAFRNEGICIAVQCKRQVDLETLSARISSLSAPPENGKEPEIEHRVSTRDSETWLESTTLNPAEMALKSRLRALLGREKISN